MKGALMTFEELWEARRHLRSPKRLTVGVELLSAAREEDKYRSYRKWAIEAEVEIQSSKSASFTSTK